MIFKPELNNKQDVLAWYDARENACFILCTGVKLDTRQIFSKWTDEDNIAGREKLEQALEFIEKNPGNYNTYTIVSFPYEEGIEKSKLKDIEGETIRFQFHSSNYSSSTIAAVAVPGSIEKSANDYGRELIVMMQKQNEAMMQRIEMLHTKIEELEQEEEEEEEPPTGKELLMGAIAGIVEKPEFTETMFGLIGMVLNKFIPVSNPSQQNEYNNGQQQ